MSDYKESSALNAGLLAAAQSVEHYEISRYESDQPFLWRLVWGRALRLTVNIIRAAVEARQVDGAHSTSFSNR